MAYETVGTLAHPRNRCSIQSGQGLLVPRKPKETLSDAHLNIHYSLAHIRQERCLDKMLNFQSIQFEGALMMKLTCIVVHQRGFLTLWC